MVPLGDHRKENKLKRGGQGGGGGGGRGARNTLYISQEINYGKSTTMRVGVGGQAWGLTFKTPLPTFVLTH